MSLDNRNQFQLVGQVQRLSIKPRVASTKYVEYVNLQQLPLLDSPQRATIFDLQSEGTPRPRPIDISLWRQLITWSAVFIMCGFFLFFYFY